VGAGGHRRALAGRRAGGRLGHPRGGRVRAATGVVEVFAGLVHVGDEAGEEFAQPLAPGGGGEGGAEEVGQPVLVEFGLHQQVDAGLPAILQGLDLLDQQFGLGGEGARAVVAVERAEAFLGDGDTLAAGELPVEQEVA
jgi:hypothetical protein